MVRVAAALLAGLALAGTAQAQNAPNCIDGLLTDEPAADKPGVVVSQVKQVHFHAGLEAGLQCPQAREKCRLKTYVVPGDKVIVAPQTVPGFACVAFVDRKGVAHVGWVAAEAVTTSPPRQAVLADWLGEWRYYNSTINIKRDKTPGQIAIDGSSFVKRLSGMVNTGDFSATVSTPTGHAVAFADRVGETVPIEKAEEFDCAVKLALMHDLMVVSSTSACGGAGVSFTGYYRRKR